MVIKANPVMVEIYRGEVLENVHRGSLCVVDEQGKVICSAGDIDRMCYPRSTLKYIQQLPLLESGAFAHYGFTLQELAVMCGSHNGESQHLALVRKILNKIGLDESHLQCGAHPPACAADLEALYSEHKKPSAIHNNCSGKHAGFLAYAQYIGADTATYLQREHPLQQAIMQATAEVYDYPQDDFYIGIDGCSAPNFAMPVYQHAMGYKNLVSTKRFSEKRRRSLEMIVRAVSENPFMVAGTGRYCTDLMQLCGSELVAKAGADGVFGLALKSRKIGLFIKIDDGKMSAQYHVAQKFVEKTGLFNPQILQKLKPYRQGELKNYAGKVTGNIRVNEEILKDFHL